MGFTQQHLFHDQYGPDPEGWVVVPSNAQFDPTGSGTATSSNSSIDDLSNAGSLSQMPIPSWYWLNSNQLYSTGTTRAVMIPDFRYTNPSTGRIFCMNDNPKSSMTGNTTFQNTNAELAGQISTDGGASFTQSGVTMPTSIIQNFTGSSDGPRDWATNGDSSSPIWIIVAGFYPNNQTQYSGSSNLQIYRSTNLSTWSRVIVPADRNSSFNGSGTNRINQFIDSITWSTDRFIIFEGRSGAISWSYTGLANTWSSWYHPTSGTPMWNGGDSNRESRGFFRIRSNNGGSKVLLLHQMDNQTSPYLRTHYSSDKGQTWDSGNYVGTDNYYRKYHNITYIDGMVNVGNSQVGPGVWVITGARYGLGYQGRLTYEELMAYSTNGTSWTEIDIPNDVTPSELSQGQYAEMPTIIDTKKGKFLMFKRVGMSDYYGTDRTHIYMSNNSLTDWERVVTSPFLSTNGDQWMSAGYDVRARNSVFFYNDRLYVLLNEKNGGSVMEELQGRVAYLQFK
tara:strand:- start:266 stop:1786 length:1521 start_codon:yes stop_codon:yes gene_type:complete